MSDKRKRIYLSPPHMSGLEQEYVKDVFKSNWIAPLGPYVDAFEGEFAKFVGVPYAAALSSGTAALHLAMRILGIGKGDEVICSSFTFCASAAPITYEGASPVFIDSDVSTWNMDPVLLEKELKRCARAGKLPKAVIVVHLYGQCADMNPIMEVCRKYNVPVIEDAAEALGAMYKGAQAGSFGDASIYSFNGNKIITTSGGGMLVSKDKTLIDKARFLSTQARDPAPHFQHSQIGYNYRMSNVLAAIGLGQLKVLQERVNRKREIFAKYQQLLGNVPGITFTNEPGWSKGNRWLTCVIIDPGQFGATNDEIRLKLEQHNIESRPLWKPLHLQPAYKKYRVCGGKVSAKLFEKGLCLPSGTAMGDDDIKMVCKIIKDMYKARIKFIGKHKGKSLCV